MLRKFGVAALSATLVVSIGNIGATTANAAESNEGKDKVENVIYMIPDGFNADYATNYRAFKGDDAVWDDHLKGMFTTYSADSSITDSAAAGTAMATGYKTNNGMLGIDPDGNERQTILESLHEDGKSTGLVATSTITHATPAAFASHVEDRDNETEIASQLLENEVDVLLGGGKNNFLPDSEGGNQEEDNILEEAQNNNYQFVETRNHLMNVDINTSENEKLLGLFADDAMSPEVHRDTAEEPSLADMTEISIDVLESNKEGFFLMVEGSQIDWAGHANDAGWAMTDIAAFEEAVQEAIDFAQEDGETLVIVAGDHETGGMTAGTDGSDTADAQKLRDVTATGESMADQLNEDISNAAEVINEHTGLDISEEEAQSIQDAEDPVMAINHVVSDQANIGWTSTNHTTVDIPVYAYGPGADQFSGYHDNIDLPNIIANLTGIDFDGKESSASQGMAHTVEPVDTLFVIGLKHNYLWTTLQDINQLENPHLIYPGQEIEFK